jgi:uncharacterized membrane protein YecN with MAPEG domain
LNGKLIHAYSFADTEDALTDSMFGVNERAISLTRSVEYYQYIENSRTETKDNLGGSQERVTTYTYTQAWVSSPVNSNNFQDPDYKDSNFVLAQVDTKTGYAVNVSFGAYRLPAFIISSIRGNEPVNIRLSDAQLQQLEDTLSRRQSGRMAHVRDNVVYFGQSISNPSVGDVRITFTKAVPGDVSIIAKVVGDTFDQFVASNGRVVSMVSTGIVSADSMIAGAKSANKALTWLIRLFGVALVIGGLMSMLSILPTLFKVLPFLGSIVGVATWLICIVGGGAWSLVVISISWLFYRPLIAIPMLVAAAGGILFLRHKSKLKKQESAQEAAHNAAHNAAQKAAPNAGPEAGV